MFSPEDHQPPSYNLFDPALAPTPERQAFRDFIDQSLQAIGDLAVPHHGSLQ